MDKMDNSTMPAPPQLLPAPSCQSCGAEMKRPTEFGTTENRVININYCRYCYWLGKFTKPDITMEEQIEKAAAAMAMKKRISLERAHNIVAKRIPKLDRWKKENKEDE